MTSNFTIFISFSINNVTLNQYFHCIFLFFYNNNATWEEGETNISFFFLNFKQIPPFVTKQTNRSSLLLLQLNSMLHTTITHCHVLILYSSIHYPIYITWMMRKKRNLFLLTTDSKLIFGIMVSIIESRWLIVILHRV
jgi:hypothetical protein